MQICTTAILATSLGIACGVGEAVAAIYKTVGTIPESSVGKSLIGWAFAAAAIGPCCLTAACLFRRYAWLTEKSPDSDDLLTRRRVFENVSREEQEPLLPS